MECKRGLGLARESCLSVRPFVKRVDCNKTEKSSIQIFTPYERPLSLVLWEEERLVGGERLLLPKILGETDLVGAKTPIFSRQLLVAHQQTSSIKTIRRSMHFPISRILTYIHVRCPYGGLKNAKRLSHEESLLGLQRKLSATTL